jgi:hypothetical protein
MVACQFRKCKREIVRNFERRTVSNVENSGTYAVSVFVLGDSRLVLQCQADIVEAIEQAILAEWVDLEACTELGIVGYRLGFKIYF